jgi:hypothetical protein
MARLNNQHREDRLSSSLGVHVVRLLFPNLQGKLMTAQLQLVNRTIYLPELGRY